MTDDRRRSSRVPVQIDALVIQRNCVEGDPAHLVNLSATGALLQMASPVEPGRTVRLLLKSRLTGGILDVVARVVRRNHIGMAVVFLALAPEAAQTLQEVISEIENENESPAAAA